MVAKIETMSETEIIRFWEMWSEEYWAAKVIRPDAQKVEQFKNWLTFAESEGEDISDEPIDVQDAAMDLLIDLFHGKTGDIS